MGHQTGSRDWVNGLWLLDRRLLSTETSFIITNPGNETRGIIHAPTADPRVIYRMVSLTSVACRRRIFDMWIFGA